MLFWEHVGQSLKTDQEDTSHCKLQIVIFAETTSHLLKNEMKSYSATKAASNNKKILRASNNDGEKSDTADEHSTKFPAFPSQSAGSTEHKELLL